MTPVQDVMQQILLTGSMWEPTTWQCYSPRVSWLKKKKKKRLVFVENSVKPLQSLACVSGHSKLSLKLYDSCLESILKIPPLIASFSSWVPKTLFLQSFNPQSGLICCSPLFPYLPQPSVTVGSSLPKHLLWKYFKAHTVSQLDIFLLK